MQAFRRPGPNSIHFNRHAEQSQQFSSSRKRERASCLGYPSLHLKLTRTIISNVLFFAVFRRIAHRIQCGHGPCGHCGYEMNVLRIHSILRISVGVRGWLAGCVSYARLNRGTVPVGTQSTFNAHRTKHIKQAKIDCINFMKLHSFISFIWCASSSVSVLPFCVIVAPIKIQPADISMPTLPSARTKHTNANTHARTKAIRSTTIKRVQFSGWEKR